MEIGSDQVSDSPARDHPSFAVVIPSKRIENLVPCIEAIYLNELCLPAERIIIVDDGLDWYEDDGAEACSGCSVISGVKPFSFSRNVNMGIRAALDMDAQSVILLNDDALLESAGGFSLLAGALERYPEYGVIGATTNNVGNRNQFRKNIGLRPELRMVCFICAAIHRRAFDAVGLLDEFFDSYACQDDDYCVRVRKAGLRIGIHDGCFVDHKTLVSTFRGLPGQGGDLRRGLEQFRLKWGCDNHAI